ncbi:hypothetical protein CC86DRAFT_146406 [Ophiobolus disseminans]|uniref:Uncharacterized protein n=1 Tax=Ophiobolus disseminans TaxID=1469910 RepID=A0A6A6ZEM3_9PLEO|nr:hypothetical protein CC86DRAFT_146406 [Ophiobolus disseminans]
MFNHLHRRPRRSSRLLRAERHHFLVRCACHRTIVTQFAGVSWSHSVQFSCYGYNFVVWFIYCKRSNSVSPTTHGAVPFDSSAQAEEYR